MLPIGDMGFFAKCRIGETFSYSLQANFEETLILLAKTHPKIFSKNSCRIIPS